MSNSNDRAPATEDVEGLIAVAQAEAHSLFLVGGELDQAYEAKRDLDRAIDALAAALRAERERARKAEEALRQATAPITSGDGKERLP